MGEIMIRGNIVMKGYITRIKKQPINQWLVVGFIHWRFSGHMHPDGYVKDTR